MLRPLDLIIALWLALQTELKTQLQIAAALGVAQSNVSRSLAQLERSGLLRAGAVQTGALLTLLGAVRMVFPAELGRRTRGLATAADGPATADRFVGEERTVWPDDGGAEVGTSLTPLHSCVVEASRRALCGAMSAGSARSAIECPLSLFLTNI